MRLEDALLLGLAQPCEQRQHFCLAQGRLVAQVLAQVVGGLADLAFAGQEHQNVAAVVWVAPQLVNALGDRIVEAVVA